MVSNLVPLCQQSSGQRNSLQLSYCCRAQHSAGCDMSRLECSTAQPVAAHWHGMACLSQGMQHRTPHCGAAHQHIAAHHSTPASIQHSAVRG
jgi:hypothetical protein